MIRRQVTDICRTLGRARFRLSRTFNREPLLLGGAKQGMHQTVSINERNSSCNTAYHSITKHRQKAELNMNMETGKQVHSLVYDREQVRQCAALLFTDQQGSDTDRKDHARILTLFARAKYSTELQKHTVKLPPHTIFTDGSPDAFLSSVLRYECTMGAYNEKNTKTGQLTQIPDEALVLYATLNCKSMTQGFYKAMLRFQELMMQMNDNDEGQDNKARTIRALRNMESVMESCVHKSNAKDGHQYYDIDLDSKDVEWVERVKSVLSECRLVEHIKAIIETRGGYHIIMLREDRNVGKKMGPLHRFCTSTTFQDTARDGKSVDQTIAAIKSDSMIPIPGTLQGGFPVRLVDVDEWFPA